MRRVCSIEGCGRKHKGRGLCGNHYQNARNAETCALVARVDAEMYQAVGRYAKKYNMAKAEVLRTFIEWGLSAK